VVWDIARSAPALRVQTVGERWRTDIYMGATMKVMAILAVLVGGLELLNTLREATAGGGGSAPTAWVVIIVLAVTAALLLLGSGVVLLSGRPRAATLARGGALACLVVFAAIAAIRPIFSIAATGLGILFPIVLLVFMFRKTGHGASPASR
jgi:hypothetical protein